uniref:Wsv460 n=1 Tax=Heterorhabditis bacteriophora TaxID=37862 RepID=A0A1I7XR04_HETBA
MASSISTALPDSLDIIISSTTKLTTSTVEQQPTQLWEMIVVVSCPVLFIIFLCCCIICMIIKNHDRPIASSQTPPPMYADIEKGVVFDPLHSLSPPSSAPSSPTSPEFTSGHLCTLDSALVVWYNICFISFIYYKISQKYIIDNYDIPITPTPI